MIDFSAIKGWVLDIDDTLYLERDYVRSGFAVVGDWLRDDRAIDGFEQIANLLFDRGVRGTIFDNALAELGIEPEPALVSMLVGKYREHNPRIGLEADAEAFLEWAAGRMPIAVVSDGPLASQARKAVALKLDTVAAPIILTERLGREYHKPSPLAFRSIQELWGLPGASLAYVADNPSKDFHGPRTLDWQTVRIVRPGGLHSALPSPEGLVSMQIVSFGDILEEAGGVSVI